MGTMLGFKSRLVYVEIERNQQTGLHAINNSPNAILSPPPPGIDYQGRTVLDFKNTE